MKFFLQISLAFFSLLVGYSSSAQTTVIFDAPGANSWTVPCGVTSVDVHLYGGGGGGGGSNSGGQAGGGGGGGYCVATFPVVPGNTYTYTVGAGGNGGNPANNGVTGTTSDWNGIMVAAGGQGGRSENNGGNGGNGGNATGWASPQTGQAGGNGGNQNGGDGGQNYGPLGGGQSNGGSPGQDGDDGSAYGGGGAGGGDKWWGSNTFGGDGADGVVVLVFTSTVTQPDAGADISSCLGITLSGNTPDAGWTAGWTVISGPASVTTPGSPTSGVTGLTPGDCSVLRWSFSFPGCPTAFDEVTVCYPAVCNDDCSTADLLVVDGPCINGDNTSAIPDASVSPSCFSGTDLSNSMWYQFVATADSITVVATAGTLTQFSMAVYSDCPATAEVGCVDNQSEMNLTGLTIGNTYYVILDGNGSSTGSFCISVFETLPPIGTCERPRRLFIANDCTKSSGCSGTNQNNYLEGNTSDDGVAWATTSPGNWSCGGNDLGQDAYWVSFNSEANNTVTFTNYGGAGNGLDYTLFTGTCASYTEVTCYTVGSGGNTAVPVTPNTEYLVLITPPFSNTPPLAFLCITAGSSFAPPNDNCVNATPILSGLNYNITNSNATVDLNNTLCAGTTENNVWVYWTADFTGPAFVNLQNQDCIESNGMQMSIYQADNNCPTAVSTCELYISPNNDDNFFGQFNAVTGQTYYMQMDGYCGTGCSFDFCITQTGGANCNALSALPVELTSFTAELVNDNDVELNWRTETEINNDYFLIERSIDGANWEDLLSVNGSGTTQESQNYYSFDYDLRESGVYYYRLTQYDYDGQSRTYIPVSLEFKNGYDDKEIVRIVNIMGVDVDESYNGVKIYVYSDGTSQKKMSVDN